MYLQVTVTKHSNKSKGVTHLNPQAVLAGDEQGSPGPPPSCPAHCLWSPWPLDVSLVSGPFTWLLYAMLQVPGKNHNESKIMRSCPQLLLWHFLSTTWEVMAYLQSITRLVRFAHFFGTVITSVQDMEDAAREEHLVTAMPGSISHVKCVKLRSDLQSQTTFKACSPARTASTSACDWNKLCALTMSFSSWAQRNFISTRHFLS